MILWKVTQLISSRARISASQGQIPAPFHHTKQCTLTSFSPLLIFHFHTLVVSPSISTFHLNSGAPSMLRKPAIWFPEFLQLCFSPYWALYPSGLNSQSLRSEPRFHENVDFTKCNPTSAADWRRVGGESSIMENLWTRDVFHEQLSRQSVEIKPRAAGKPTSLT